MIQLAVMYFMNGYYKAMGPQWRDGSVMIDVANNPTWAHFSPNYLPMPDAALQALAWGTVFWELFFPVLVLMSLDAEGDAVDRRDLPRGTLVHLEVGWFPLYSLCYYVPLVPWERWKQTRDTRHETAMNSNRWRVSLTRDSCSSLLPADAALGRASAGPRPSCGPCRSPCP